MSRFALLNATVWGGGYDFTGDSNSVNLATEVDVLDVTTFGSGGWQENIAGLRSIALEVAGFWQAGAGAVDPEVWAGLGGSAQVHMVSAANTETQPAYGFQALKSSYSLLGDIGKAAPFSLKGVGAGAVPEVRGQIAKAKGSVAATGQLGSILTLGAPLAGQSAYAGLHVFGTPGTTITVQIQSAPTIGFASPTTRGTLGPITATGGTWMVPVAGPITDAFWRANVSAITGTFTVGAWIAVQ